jgi:hypothetical protein
MRFNFNLYKKSICQEIDSKFIETIASRMRFNFNFCRKARAPACDEGLLGGLKVFG